MGTRSTPIPQLPSPIPPHRVAVLDIDFHHGNGTQQIFYERDDVLFVSIHADPVREYPYFAGYAEDPALILQKTFEEIDGYDEMIVLRGIRFESHCGHHLAPIIGRAWVGYIPNGRVVGISKLARVVETYARRLQVQERMTAQIANAINDVLKPQGVGVIVKAAHHCMTTRGVHKTDTDLLTSHMLGCFRDNPATRREFLSLAV